jgi:hypothetical protein
LVARIADKKGKAREQLEEHFASQQPEALSRMFTPEGGKLRQLTNEEVRAMVLREQAAGRGVAE